MRATSLLAECGCCIAMSVWIPALVRNGVDRQVDAVLESSDQPVVASVPVTRIVGTSVQWTLHIGALAPPAAASGRCSAADQIWPKQLNFYPSRRRPAVANCLGIEVAEGSG